MRIKAGPSVYTVRSSRDLNAELGTTDCDRLEILLSTEQSPERRRVTLMHEVLHVVFDLAGIGIGEDKEEDLIRPLTPALLQILRDNPALRKELGL